MSTVLKFVRGHCGWDLVTLIPEGQIPPSEELAASIKIVSSPLGAGLEVGWMGFGKRANEITLRMVNSTTKDWIPMCGGMTQVIGKALVETFLGSYFQIDTSQPVITACLMTVSGEIPVRIEHEEGRVRSVTTTMDNYLTYLYGGGLESLLLQEVPVLRVGTYAVIDVAELEQRHPGIEFRRRDPGPHLDIVNGILRQFGHRLGLTGVNGMLYDDQPEASGQYRVFPRFYSDDLAAARIPWEFQCGTGSVAVAAALAYRERLTSLRDSCDVLLEWGSYRATPDPYGIRLSRLSLKVMDRRLTGASFSHSVVEILAEGRMTLPAY